MRGRKRNTNYDIHQEKNRLGEWKKNGKERNSQDSFVNQRKEKEMEKNTIRYRRCHFGEIFKVIQKNVKRKIKGTTITTPPTTTRMKSRACTLKIMPRVPCDNERNAFETVM